MRTRLLILALASMMASVAFACPPDMQGTLKIVVTYVPAKNWDLFSMYVDQHLAYLSAQMKAGNVEFAGPFLKDDDVDGGLSIYNSDDEDAVRLLVRNDPVVRNDVVSAWLKTWMQCELKK